MLRTIADQNLRQDLKNGYNTEPHLRKRDKKELMKQEYHFHNAELAQNMSQCSDNKWEAASTDSYKDLRLHESSRGMQKNKQKAHDQTKMPAG